MKHSCNIQGDEGELEHGMVMGSICGGEDETSRQRRMDRG